MLVSNLTDDLYCAVECANAARQAANVADHFKGIFSQN